MLKDLNDQIVTLRDNISYVQDNINECQTSIVQMEENKVRIAYLGPIRTEERDISSTRRHRGPFTRTVSEPMFVTVTIKVYHSANGDVLFDTQIELGTHFVHQCKFDGDCNRDGEMVRVNGH